ncbi:MAG TPA: prolyl oligopeptidase family serine peptidase [Opitutaceae bacterium]|nr:prolyl oligopeptidase family serine peptidase [Opitutaceae bacterium]
MARRPAEARHAPVRRGDQARCGRGLPPDCPDQPAPEARAAGGGLSAGAVGAHAARFQPEVQALAEMGFAIVQMDPPGAWGRGVRRRESIRAGYDEAQVEEIGRIVDELARSFAIDPRRVALLGTGHGGYVALRALATEPGRFRCAVALEPPVDLARAAAGETDARAVASHLVRSYYGPREALAARPLRAVADRITQPVLVLSYPGPDGAPRRESFVAARGFAQAVRRPGVEARFLELSKEFAAGLPGAKAATYQEIESFLNSHLYDFTVKVGTPTVSP